MVMGHVIPYLPYIARRVKVPPPTVHLETLEPQFFLNNSTNTHCIPPKPFNDKEGSP